MNSLPALYRAHLDSLVEHARIILARSQHDALLIHSGEPIMAFLDDHAYPLKLIHCLKHGYRLQKRLIVGCGSMVRLVQRSIFTRRQIIGTRSIRCQIPIGVGSLISSQ